MCLKPYKRRLHLVDKHCFPGDYDFLVVNEGIDGKTSMLRSARVRRRSFVSQQKAALRDRKAKTEPIDEGDGMDVDVPVEVEKKTDGEKKRPRAPTGTLRPEQLAMESMMDTGTENKRAETIMNTKPQKSDSAMDVDSLAGAFSALRFVPPSIRFGGRGRGKAGLSKS